jgi:hypothetical protein
MARPQNARRSRARFGAFAAAAVAVAVATLTTERAHGIDRFELQVYRADINEPLHPGLEIHTNYAPRARREADYEGETPPNAVGRMTFEPALGLTSWLEVGGYLQTYVAPGEGVRYGGVKVRAKAVLYRGERLFAGLNMEVGRVPHAVEEDSWANEFRPFLGFYDGRWLAVVNPIFGYSLTGPHHFQPHFEPAGKLAWNTQLGIGIGVEYYAGFGEIFRSLVPFREQEHYVFVTIDAMKPRGASAGEEGFELNIGIGRSLVEDAWVLKSIFGRSF